MKARMIFDWLLIFEQGILEKLEFQKLFPLLNRVMDNNVLVQYPIILRKCPFRILSTFPDFLMPSPWKHARSAAWAAAVSLLCCCAIKTMHGHLSLSRQAIISLIGTNRVLAVVVLRSAAHFARYVSVAYLEGCRWVLSTHQFLDMGAEHPSILSKISLDVGTFKKEILLIRTHYF